VPIVLVQGTSTVPGASVDAERLPTTRCAMPHMAMDIE